MRRFAITMDGHGSEKPKRIEFVSDEPDLVFHILAREAVGRAAILWEGERRLATVRRTGTGGWQIAR